MTTTPPEAPAPPPPADAGPRVSRDDVRDLTRLRRSREDRKVAGVAGGLARHLDIDPIITRVLLVVLVFFGGAGILLYAVVWLVVPTEGTEEVPVRLDDRSRSVVLVVVGLIAALAVIGDSLGGWGPPWPVVVTGVVVLVVLLARGGEPRLHPFLRGQGPTGPTPYGPVTLTKPVQPTKPVKPLKPVDPRRRGPVLFWYAVALIALGVGVLGVVDTAGADLTPSAYPALALGTCAALLVLGAFWGRAGGLILLGLVAAVATAGATVVAEADIGRIGSTPQSASGVQDRYDLTFGEIDLDLTEVVDPAALDGRTIEVDMVCAGRIDVRVPDDVDVVVRTRIDEGEVRVLGDRLADGDQTTMVDGGPDAPVLTLDLTTGFGEITVTQEEAVR